MIRAPVASHALRRILLPSKRVHRRLKRVLLLNWWQAWPVVKTLLFLKELALEHLLCRPGLVSLAFSGVLSDFLESVLVHHFLKKVVVVHRLLGPVALFWRVIHHLWLGADRRFPQVGSGLYLGLLVTLLD